MRHAALVMLASEAYSSNDVLTTSEVDVLLTETPTTVILAVRGTEGSNLFPLDFSWGGLMNWKDVFRDMRFYPMNTHHGRVHRGFRLSALRWYKAFKGELDFKREYVLTGHSKGAAEAVQLAMLMASHGHKVKQVTVFAEPASLFYRARKHYATLGIESTSYINRGDPIKWTPPWAGPCVKRTKVAATKRGHSMRNYVDAILTEARRHESTR